VKYSDKNAGEFFRATIEQLWFQPYVDRLPPSLRRATTHLLICLLVAAMVRSPSAQIAGGRETAAASAAGYPLSADMPVDPEVLIGGLPNGLRFYIRPNTPGQRVRPNCGWS